MNTSAPAPVDEGSASEARHTHRQAVSTGAQAIGRLVIGRARVRRLEIDDLVIRQLRLPSDHDPASWSGGLHR